MKSSFYALRFIYRCKRRHIPFPSGKKIMLPFLFYLISAAIFIRAQVNQWSWFHGPAYVYASPNYGTQGVAALSNLPAPRFNSVCWTDASGKFWMFGGNSTNLSGIPDTLKNDIWKWNGTNWTWVYGDTTRNNAGRYGTQGVAAAANMPGSRSSSASWTDAAGNLWLYGGYGIGINPSSGAGRLNDIWKWDGNMWTWVSGSTQVNQPGVYGTKGITAATNIPGGRNLAATWKDAAGNFWVFGGFGVSAAGLVKQLNDLWKWDGTNWTWYGGDSLGNKKGIYGVKGVAAAANIPGCRLGTVSWRDAAGNFWLMGGNGYDSAGTSAKLNDLWKWNGSMWTWVSGSNTVNQAGVYGTKGVAAASNIPGARSFAVCWTDNNGAVWIFGGNGLDASGASGRLNDLWKWDGTSWTWMGGSTLINQNGVYGTPGVLSPSNQPGARERPAVWKDVNNSIWIFGGMGYAQTGSPGSTNDLWRYNLDVLPLPMQLISFSAAEQQNEVLLKWETAYEENIKEYVVEKSSNGTDFETAGIATAKNEGHKSQYQISDRSAWASDIRYYRLRFSDNDDKIRFSEIIKLNRLQSRLYVYPNPVTTVCNMYLTNPALLHTEASLYDIKGRLLKLFHIGSLRFTADLSGLLPGAYFIRLADGTQQKIVKQGHF